MATESNVQSSEDVRSYRGRTLEEILPQIREELGPDAIILREREGLVGGVGGFFAQRFIEVEARRGDGLEIQAERGSGSSIDIYDEDDDDLGFGPPAPEFAAEQPLLGPGDLSAGSSATDEPLDFGAGRQTAPVEEPTRSEPKPFVPQEVQRERIIPRDPQGEPAAPTRRFETDVFLERLREASQVLPENDEEFDELTAAAPLAPPGTPPAAPGLTEPETAAPDDLAEPGEAELESEPEIKPRRPARRGTPERKPRATQPRKPRPAPRGKGAARAEPEAPAPAPRAPVADAWTTAMAALVAEPEPTAPPRPSAARPTSRPAAPSTRNPYDELRQRPSSLRTGLPTEPTGARPAAPAPQPIVPIPVPAPVAPLEFRGRREGGLRGIISRLLGGRLGATALPRPSTPHPIDAAAASALAAELTVRGASQSWTGQLIGTAAAHGTALSGSLVAAAEAELARRIVPAQSLPATGAAVAFIGAGGTGKTRCTAALASAYSRASTLGVVVIAVDNPGGARELRRLLEADGVPVLSLSGERAQQAVAAYREGGFVIVDTPTTTPTDAAALEALGASLAPLELDATFVALPATLGPQAARRALAGFGRLNPSAVAITHADETDHLAVVVEIAIANRIPLAYFHAGTDHRKAMSAIDASVLARRLLSS
jgi:flagellar biosynthesis GTPase FlhF